MIIQLPPILPGELDLVDINKKLRQHQIILDWSSVISAPEAQLEILLDGIDLGKDADWLGIDGEISDHIANDIAGSGKYVVKSHIYQLKLFVCSC